MSQRDPSPENDPGRVAPDDVVSGDPSGVGAVGPSTIPEGRRRPAERAPGQTLAGRVWVALACAAILLVLIIIFIAENSHSVTVSFLGAHGHISEALALLIAVVVGIAMTLLVGSARIVQLSMQVRRERRRARRSD